MPFAPERQLELVWPVALPERRSEAAADAESLDIHGRRIESILSILLGRSVTVVLNDNRSTMISHKVISDRLVARLHRMFRHAEGDDLHALADFLAGRRGGSGAVLDRFIERHRDEVERKPKGRRRSGVVATGQHHDLEEILARVKARYFAGRGEVDVGWGKAPSTRRRRRSRGGTRSRALATYSFDDRSIRVSQVLDSARVPRYVLEWVVYHEMLHHVLPIEEREGRRRYHTRSFKALERAFEGYEKAVAWEEANLDWLLR